jgi:hypothetical protein
MSLQRNGDDNASYCKEHDNVIVLALGEEFLTDHAKNAVPGSSWAPDRGQFDIYDRSF